MRRRNFTMWAITVGFIGGILSGGVALAEPVAFVDEFDQPQLSEDVWEQDVNSLWVFEGGVMRTDLTFEEPMPRTIFASPITDADCAVTNTLGTQSVVYADDYTSISLDVRFQEEWNFMRTGVFLLADVMHPDIPALYAQVALDFDYTPFIAIGFNADIADLKDELDIVLGQQVLPAEFDFTQWHHLNVVLENRQLTMVLDGTTSLTATIPDTLPQDGLPFNKGTIGLWANTPPIRNYEYDNFHLEAEAICGMVPLTALVDLSPDFINVQSTRRFMVGYITLPEGYSLAEIDFSTIQIGGTSCDPDYQQPIVPWFEPRVGDYDGDGVPDLTVLLDRQALQANLCLGQVPVRLEGQLMDGTPFAGAETLVVFSR